MSSVSSEELKKILDVVEVALFNHSKWYEDLMRRLLCRLPLPDAVIAKDAHRQCAFGTWFYKIGETYVEDLPAFKKIGEMHRVMHENAREVSQIIKANGYATEMEYDSFHRKLMQFRGELGNLRDKICRTLAHTDTNVQTQEAVAKEENGLD
ncbi:MAG: CZB domain-containing protein [Gammaproteobacteria bacterium]|nr:CZB domain-containing protein [Gammaproteobacteria bacterium]